jgi:integrase
MPIDEYIAHDLLSWYEVTPYKKPSDYVWATDANRAGAKRGKQPVWLSAVMRDYIQPSARKLGINKKISWHTFRHTFSTLLKGNGEDVKVVQELLRHSTAKMTLDTYTGLESAEASGPKQGSRHDPLETKLYRRCTASFWGNPGNSLIRFGVPDGI